jgi:hypothetical protein
MISVESRVPAWPVRPIAKLNTSDRQATDLAQALAERIKQ